MSNDDEDKSQAAKSVTKKRLSTAAKKGIIIFCAILAILLFIGFYQIYSINISSRMNSQGGRSNTQLIRPNTSTSSEKSSGVEQLLLRKNGYIAVVYIEGIIQDKNQTYNQAWLLDTIENLTYDETNQAILLYIDSPGGGVYQSDEVYLALEDYKARSGKPIWAYMGPLAASGGYYIACAADTIYANRNTLTGSIGVIAGLSIDLTEWMDRYGIKMTTISAGKNKNMMNINSPITAQQRAIVQSIADGAYDQFTKIVAQSRNMNIERVQELSDGRIYTAAQAAQHGLIDWIATFENTISDMKENLFDNQPLELVHYKPTDKKTFYDFLYEFTALFAQNTGTLDTSVLKALQNVLPDNMAYPAYYYTYP